MEMAHVKAMTAFIPAPNSGSIMEKKNKKKIQVAKWSKSTKNIKKQTLQAPKKDYNQKHIHNLTENKYRTLRKDI